MSERKLSVEDVKLINDTFDNHSARLNILARWVGFASVVALVALYMAVFK